MLNIFEFLGKNVIDFNSCLSLGEVQNFVFTPRLRKLLYLKTSKNYYIELKKITAKKDVIVTNSHLENIGENLFTISPNLQAIKLDGVILGKVTKIIVNNSGFLDNFEVNNLCFNFKDIFNLSNELILLQADKRKKPISIKSTAKNKPIALIHPVKKEVTMLSNNEKYHKNMDDYFDDEKEYIENDTDIDDDAEDDEDESNNDSNGTEDENEDKEDNNVDEDDNDDENDDDDENNDNDCEDEDDNADSEDNNNDEDKKPIKPKPDDEDTTPDTDSDNEVSPNDNRDSKNNVIANPQKTTTYSITSIKEQLPVTYYPTSKVNKSNEIKVNLVGNMLVQSVKMPEKVICNTEILEGRKTSANIFLDNGKCLIKKNTTLSPNIIVLAGKNNKLIDITKSCK